MSENIRYANGFFSSFLPAVFLGLITSSPALAYELIDLGEYVEPKAINNFGVVVGSSNTDQYPATAFSWSSISGFKLINGGTSANAVNDAGQIAGSTIDGAFVDNHEWSDYGAFGINKLGEVAGYKVGKNLLQPRSLPYNPAIFNGNKWEVYDIARLYPRGTREDVYADRFILNGINKYGYTVGYKYRYGLATYTAILIDPNVTVNDLSDVVYLPTYGGRAVDINDANMIVGTTANNTRVTPVIYSRAFIYDYTDDILTVLSVLEGGLHSHAADINESNVVVGYSESAAGNRAVLWDKDDGGVTDLHKAVLALAEGWVLTSATAINDNGDIAGTGTLYGVPHGFVLSMGAISAQPPAQNQDPVAVANANVTSGKASLPVNFSSASTDPDGTIEGYSWDFMDGSFSAEENPTHVFTDPGTYQVTLTVTDDLGATASDSIKITVRKGKRK